MRKHGHAMHMRRAVLWSVGLGLVLCLGGLSAISQESGPGTQVSMRSIFATLSKAYNYSLDPEYFDAEENRQEILAMLKSLDASTDYLEAHGGGLDASFDYHRRALARDAGDALMQFKLRNHVGARFVLSKMTENCVGCHTKLPSERQFDVGKEFLKSANVQDLPNYSRVNLEVATRQFDTAAKTYEDMLASPDMRAADYSLHSVFERYLKVCLGALDDPQRAAKSFRAFSERTDMPKDLSRNAAHFADVLDGLDLDASKGNELEAAREMIGPAVEGPKVKKGHLVDFIAAGALLHRFLATEPSDDGQISEAYYLLGVAESHVTQSYWLSEVSFLLENAIRQAPKSETAKLAFAYLEDYTESQHMVSPARAVPPELETNLDELRALVEK